MNKEGVEEATSSESGGSKFQWTPLKWQMFNLHFLCLLPCWECSCKSPLVLIVFFDSIQLNDYVSGWGKKPGNYKGALIRPSSQCQHPPFPTVFSCPPITRSKHQTHLSLMPKLFCSSNACTMEVRKSWLWISLDIPWQPSSSWACTPSWLRSQQQVTDCWPPSSVLLRGSNLTWPMSLMHDTIIDSL